ncbi:MAG: preprotein translocase subunit SecA [Gammaproteobacteria bacterium RIFCSPHIGHO2_02_FULL_42_13]|nr:MAG: preprotein translocase subunit SecA [Gammaproteobacteria bacterium RIFCSPHIGHO2_02_FULL_42_13]OGT67486.1 MAG: preprotein translocase subunit SecA [Gammaproteobacteria bacterium RIFCSPLOWO2_02_FULL_42_9]HLB58033.1 preprotein translocase subunit SecA [Gammaproteobacteria bacterium]
MIVVSRIIKLFCGSRNERIVKKLYKTVVQVNAYETEYEQLSDEELRKKTDEFRLRLRKDETLNDLLPEAFAVAREASKRTLGLRPFDVQLIGGMILHYGKIAEMCTGEGKTLAATMPVYLNALTGNSVHLVTVNDYLASRDAAWMKPIYEFLGLTVGVNLANMTPEEKRAAYAADVTYGTNNEFGFDYLRDNMAFTLEERVQRDLSFAIVDEVDSILIDEARTPLIISGSSEDSSDLYKKINQLIPKLTLREEEGGLGDYYLDEKQKQAFLTEEGHEHIEELLYKEGLLKEGDSLYDVNNIILMHHLNAALRSHKLYQRDTDYIVKDGTVVIVDEHTGRTMPGRRWSDGLHQAVEAKENVEIRNENQTLATITFQNYFRLYDKLAGMTGTADTEAYEFQQIYNLEVVVIPTNRPLIRKDSPDRVFLTIQEKFAAIIEEIKDCRLNKQPVLVGTASIENSELLSEMLKKEKIPHNVLNAKNHEREAEIVMQAGLPGAVTIATNMAGRGTDIILGGNVEAEIKKLDNPGEEEKARLRREWQERHDLVLESGGLHMIGSERHESRRIDNQLRGRSGRQGDPGSSRFYVSFQDNLMRIFASDRVSTIMKRLGMKEGDAIEHRWVTKAIENAQRKVETFHFDIRKQLLEFDDVANDQRKVIYKQRTDLMAMNDISETIRAIFSDVADQIVSQYVPPESMEEMWDIPDLEKRLKSDFELNLPISVLLKEDTKLHEDSLRQLISDRLWEHYKAKEALAGAEPIRQFEKAVLLQTLDAYWKEHLATMDQLRQSIHLMGYAQKDPKQEYKRESFHLFSDMLNNIKIEVVRILSTVKIQDPEDVDAIEEQRRRAAPTEMHYQHPDGGALDRRKDKRRKPSEEKAQSSVVKIETMHRDMPKVGRNDPCPCGSGKKYKHCCGALQ